MAIVQKASCPIPSAYSMSSLADLPQLIGFFSYSRDDDEGDDGAVSALSDRIYRELRGQLGRTRENFQLWRDKDALAVGEHWKAKLKDAVSESVFFIAMVTPSAVKSPFCRFEFESFVERERALGRDDLVFPILYIAVPELEDERKETDPVVSIIAERQYVDWRSIRHGDVNSTAVKRTVEEFCKDIAKKLRQPWISPEERGAIDAENRANDKRLRQEAEAKRRAQEEERRKIAEARRRAEEEWQQQEAQRLEEERRANEERATKEAAVAEQKRREKEERTAEKKNKEDQRKPKVEQRAATRTGALATITTWLKTMPNLGAFRILGALLVFVGVVRVMILSYWLSWLASQVRVDVSPAGWALFFLWCALAAFTFIAGLGTLRRSQWSCRMGLLVCGVGVLNDLFLSMVMLMGRPLRGPDIILMAPSVPYAVVYLVGFVYFLRWNRSLSRAALS
jgi:hypothetical protein